MIRKSLFAALAAALAVTPIAAFATCSTAYDGIYASPNVTYYADPAGSDAGNTCTSITYPCTLQGAVNAAIYTNATATNLIAVQLANGTYNPGFAASGSQPAQNGAIGSSFVGIIGCNGSANVTISDDGTKVTQAATIVVADNLRLAIRGVKITSKNGAGIYSNRNSFIAVDKDVTWGQVALAQVHAEAGSVIEIGQGETIDNTGVTGAIAAEHYQSRVHGYISLLEKPQVISIIGTPSFSQFFADGEEDGVIYSPSAYISYAGPQDFAGTGSITGTVLTISATASTGLTVGSIVAGPNFTSNATIQSFGSGTGGNGTYNILPSQTAASGAVSGYSNPNFAGTGSITTTVLTVTATTTPGLAVGSVVTGPNIASPATITSLGSGTGGNGTYNILPSQSAASAAVAGVTATGFRYYAGKNGVIQTNAGSETYLPGNGPGQINSNGVYAPAGSPTAGTLTGLGTAPSGSVSGGDRSFTLLLTTGTGAPANNGTAAITFATKANGYNCSATPTGAGWALGATARFSALAAGGATSYGTGTITWSNNGTALSVTAAYPIGVVCQNTD